MTALQKNSHGVRERPAIPEPRHDQTDESVRLAASRRPTLEPAVGTTRQSPSVGVAPVAACTPTPGGAAARPDPTSVSAWRTPTQKPRTGSVGPRVPVPRRWRQRITTRPVSREPASDRNPAASWSSEEATWEPDATPSEEATDPTSWDHRAVQAARVWPATPNPQRCRRHHTAPAGPRPALTPRAALPGRHQPQRPGSPTPAVDDSDSTRRQVSPQTHDQRPAEPSGQRASDERPRSPAAAPPPP